MSTEETTETTDDVNYKGLWPIAWAQATFWIALFLIPALLCFGLAAPWRFAPSDCVEVCGSGNVAEMTPMTCSCSDD